MDREFLVLAAVAAAAGLLLLSWGPAVHVWAGTQTLNRLKRKKQLRPEEKLVLKYSEEFLYGTIAADIISFKKFGGFKNHCHNWNMRERMNPLLSTPRRRAFGLGYLCHLAADIGSHNHFVPYHRVAELPPRLLGHAFWESRADSLCEEKYWTIIETLRRREDFQEFDEIIDEAVQIKALSLRSNRLIFHTVVLGAGRPMWRKARGLLKKKKKKKKKNPPQIFVISKELLHLLKTRMLHDMRIVLGGTDWAALTSQDPSGRVALKAARALRRQLLSQYETREAALPVARRLAKDCFWPPEG